MEHGIIIPCYNESKRLKFKAFQNFLHRTNNIHLCFVNDGSKDNTLELLTKFRNKNINKVSVVDMPQNGGKAEAVRTGVKYLIENTPVEDLGFMDADLSTSFEEYADLVKQLNSPQKNLKLVFGSRKGEASGNTERSRFRKLMSNIIGLMIQMILGLPIKDTQCGAKVFTLETARYCFNKPFVSRWLFDVEIFIRMKRLYSRQNLMRSMLEIPLKKWIAVGDSKLTFKESVKIPLQLLKIASIYYAKPNVDKVFKFVLSFNLNLFEVQKT